MVVAAAAEAIVAAAAHISISNMLSSSLRGESHNVTATKALSAGNKSVRTTTTVYICKMAAATGTAAFVPSGPKSSGIFPHSVL